MFNFISFHCLLFIFINNIYAESDIFSCLHLKSLCKRIPQCYKHLKHFESRCGISIHNCQTETISDCVHCLRSIRESLGVYNGTCWCYENQGALKQCEHFRSKIWNHPCEKVLSNYHVENALLISEAELPLPLQNTLLFSEDSDDDIDVFSNSLKRTTRSPMATEIQQWRHQLDSSLPAVRPQRAELTCHGALYDVCLKHIACRELWKIFRQSCIVDAQNQCKMTNPDNCWQSFEGISWTGLGNCTCTDSNSDCHWIRLQTNYNKCIYELTLSGQASKPESVASLTYIEQYRQHHSYTTPPSTIFTTETSIETTSIVFKNTQQDTRQFQQQQQNNNYYWQEEERKRLQEVERKRQEEQQKRHEEERKKYEEERNRIEKLRQQRQKEIEERQRIYEEQLKKSREQNYDNNYGRQNQNNNQNQNQYRGYVRADLKVATTTPRTIATALPTPPISTTRRTPTTTTSTTTTTTTTTTTPIPTTIATTPSTTTTSTTTEEPPTVTIASEEDFDENENNNSAEEEAEDDESNSKTHISTTTTTSHAFIVSKKQLNIQKNIKREGLSLLSPTNILFLSKHKFFSGGKKKFFLNNLIADQKLFFFFNKHAFRFFFKTPISIKLQDFFHVLLFLLAMLQKQNDFHSLVHRCVAMQRNFLSIFVFA